MKKSLLLLTVAFSLVFTNNISAQKKLRLELKLKEGDSFLISSSTDQLIEVGIMGTVQEVTQQMGFTYNYDVESVAPNGDMQVKATYKRIKFKTSSMQGEEDYDSEDPESEPGPNSMGMAAMVGKSFTILFGSNGVIKEVDGLNELINTVFDEYDNLTEEQKAQMTKIMKQQFGNEAMKRQLSLTSDIYPDSKVRKGDSWAKEYALEGAIGMLMNTQFKLEEIKDDYALVSYRTTITPNEEGGGLDMGAMKINYKVQGSQTGNMKIKLDNGFPFENSGQQDLEGTMDISSDMTGDMSGDVKINSTISMSQTK